MRACLRAFAVSVFMVFASAIQAPSAIAQLAGEATYDFDIPAGPLEDALRKVAAEENLQILFAPEDLKGLTTTGLKGRFSPSEAIAGLLKGTSLTVSTNGNRVFAIKPPVASKDKTTDLHRGEQIMVSAQKRDERAFDVPISLVALSADELQKRKVNSIEDLNFAVPGIAVQSGGGVFRRIALRGLSNSAGPGAPLVGMYLDEASVSPALQFTHFDLRTYDLERVEVLRGPQGTLYGEGSLGGTIRFITRSPELDRFEFGADAAATYTKNGAPSQRIESVVNVPLVGNEFGIRIAGTFDHQGGWIDQPAAGRKDVNSQNLADVRIKALWQPTTNLSLNATALTHRNDFGINAAEDSSGNTTQVFNLTTSQSMRDDYDLYNATIAYDWPTVRLLGTTSYVRQDQAIREQGFRSPTGPPPASRVDIYIPQTDIVGTNYTHELRLTSHEESPLQWTLGAMYRRSFVDDSVPLTFVAFPIAPGAPLPSNPSRSRFTILSNSWAVFGDASYKTDRWTIGTGLRYFEDDRELNRILPATAIQSGTFDALTPRVYAQYKASESANIYASAAKGFRSGGFNALNQPPYDPETVWTYEVGTKVALPGGRFNAEVALYYSDYTNYQIAGVTPSFPSVAITSNAGNARIRGIEWALTWRPEVTWMVSFNGNYAHSEFYQIKAANSAYAVGDELERFPKYSYTFSLQRDFDYRGKAGFARLDFNQIGKSTYRFRNAGPWFYGESDVISMLNFNMGLQWNQNLSLNVFGQNLLNDRGFIDPTSIQDVAGRARPLTVGVGFGVTF
jgi:iron complex outermembrane receptor protein